MLKRIIVYFLLLSAGLTVALSRPSESVALGETVSCTDCGQCAIPGTDKHVADIEPSGGFQSNGGHDCWLVPCGHPACPSGGASLDGVLIQEEVDNLLDRAFDGDPGAVLALLNVYPDLATANYERNALQVVAPCEKKAVIAHIPLTSEMLAAIELRERMVGTRLAHHAVAGSTSGS